MNLRSGFRIVLIDTNVLLDMALSSRPDSQRAQDLLEAGLRGRCRLSVSSGSLKDFYYIARKDLDEDLRRAWISFFLDVLLVFQLDAHVCRLALDSNEPDFEDGIVRAIAESNAAFCIVSRDESAFLGSSISRLTAEEALALL